MTRAEEIARKIVADYAICVDLTWYAEEIEDIATALESYAAEERERCAKIAEDSKIDVNPRAPYQIGVNGACAAIAARIREAGEPKA